MNLKPIALALTLVAAPASARRSALNSASTQARATTAAPLAGLRASIASIWRAISSAVVSPFSIRSSRIAISITRAGLPRTPIIDPVCCQRERQSVCRRASDRSAKVLLARGHT